MTPRARLIARRLYLSALVPLSVVGAVVVFVVGASALHDRAVTVEDRACFLAAMAKRDVRSDGLPPLPAGDLDMATEELELELARGRARARVRVSDAERCHLDFRYDPEGRSTRQWYGLDLSEGVGVSVLAILPSLLLMGLARWVRWILKP